jgi:di/tricarboxylate transporter
LTWEAWFTLATILVLIVALVREWARVDVTVLSALGVLLVVGVVTPVEAFSGFSDPAVITIASLYVVAAGIHRTGVLSSIDRLFVTPTGSVTPLLFRIMIPTAALSAVLNNTPVVAMLMPRLQSVASKTGISISKLLMPLSFAAIAGGMITLIGTSTNLIASGLLRDAGYPGFGLFEFAWIGLPAAAFTVLYLSTIGHRLIPDCEPDERDEVDALDYQFELRVPEGSRLAGMTVQEARLRALGDAYLVHIHRDGHTIGPVTPDEVLQGSDVLTFTGRSEAMERLLLQTDFHANVDGPPLHDGESEIPLYEAVVSATSTLVGKTLKEAGFREKYQGVVLAIHRQDESLRGALGNVALKPGDLLLIEARTGFEKSWNQSQGDFYLVTPKMQIQQGLSRKAPIALALLVATIGLHILGVLTLAASAFAAAMLMVLLGCLRGTELRKSIDLTVMLTIAAAFGVGHAVQASGLAAVVGHGVASALPGQGPIAVMALLYLITLLLTEIVTNSAAVVIMIPIAVAAAVDLGIDPHAVALTVTIASSASFLSPLGYQTNLMVMGAGGYRFQDYFRAGLPVSIGIMIITLTVIALRWL